MKPYKVASYNWGAANVIDRKTGEQVGYLLQDFHRRWNGYLTGNRGVVVVTERYRSDAARRLFDFWVRARVSDV